MNNDTLINLTRMLSSVGWMGVLALCGYLSINLRALKAQMKADRLSDDIALTDRLDERYVPASTCALREANINLLLSANAKRFDTIEQRMQEIHQQTISINDKLLCMDKRLFRLELKMGIADSAKANK